MIYTEMTVKAMNLMFERMKDHKPDKGSVPYVFHPWHVAESMEDEITCTTALLHDLVEDHEGTFEELEQMFPSEVTDALKLLTHDKEHVSYEDYVRMLAHNPIARKVKLSDLRHNMDTTRLPLEDQKLLKEGKNPKAQERLDKYHRCYEYLMNIEKCEARSSISL